MAVYFGPNPEVTSGLILKLDATRKDSYPGTGTTWYDISGNQQYATASSVDYSSSQGGSFRFDGTTNPFTIINPITQLKSIQTEFSICGWVNYNTMSSPWRVFNIFNQAGYSYQGAQAKRLMIVRTGSTNNLAYETTESLNDGLTTVVGSKIVPADINQWIYVGVTVQNYPYLTCTLFINDYFETGITDRPIGPKNIDKPIFIGQGEPLNNSRISQVLFYNRPLSIFEHRQNYNSRRGLYYS